MLLNPGADLGEDFPSNWTGMIMKNKQTKREWRSFQKQVNTELVAIITDLKRSMSEVKINQDW
jgi:hypothetical protein